MSVSPDLTDDRVDLDGAGGRYADLHDRSLADMIERLFGQFEDRLTLPEIVQVVRESREQLRGSPIGALPELTERLAYERLTTLGGPGQQPAAVPA